jgi:hypothetical protein
VTRLFLAVPSTADNRSVPKPPPQAADLSRRPSCPIKSRHALPMSTRALGSPWTHPLVFNPHPSPGTPTSPHHLHSTFLLTLERREAQLHSDFRVRCRRRRGSVAVVVATTPPSPSISISLNSSGWAPPHVPSPFFQGMPNWTRASRLQRGHHQPRRRPGQCMLSLSTCVHSPGSPRPPRHLGFVLEPP